MSALLSIVAPQVIPPPIPMDVNSMVAEMWEIARVHKSNMAKLAYVGWRLHYALNGDYAQIGYASEDAFRKALGIAQSTYYVHVGIGKVLCTMKLADLEAIPLENRKLLAYDIDPSIRDQYDWIAEAKRLPPEQFALKIAERNRERGSDKEPMARMSLKMPVTAKIFVEETLESYRVKNELPSIAEALEFMVADGHDRKDNAATALVAAKQLRMAMFRFRDHSDSWARTWMANAHRTLLRIARMEGVVDAENAKAVYPTSNPQIRKDFAIWEANLLKQSGRAAGEEIEGDGPVEVAGGDVRSMPSGDAADREYADFAGGQG